jgi:hypothetical protein
MKPYEAQPVVPRRRGKISPRPHTAQALTRSSLLWCTTSHPPKPQVSSRHVHASVRYHAVTTHPRLSRSKEGCEVPSRER